MLDPAEPSRLDELAREGRRAAEHGDLEAVAAALVERRACLARLAPGRIAATDLAALERVRALDAETAALLEARRNRLGAELQALGEGRRGLAGYRPGTRAASRIDERG